MRSGPSGAIGNRGHAPPERIRIDVGEGFDPDVARARLEEVGRGWENHLDRLELRLLHGFPPDDGMWQWLREVRTNAPECRIVLQVDGESPTGMSAIHHVLSAPLSELEIRTRSDAVTPGTTPDRRALLFLKQLVELRDARRQEHPRVTWLHEPTAGDPVPEPEAADLRGKARQIGVDRFAVLAVGACDFSRELTAQRA